jgi:hypothetical protein
MTHYREALRYFEQANDRYEAGDTRVNVAQLLHSQGRHGDALLWAQAALRDYESYGDRAAADIADTRQLIATIEQAQADKRG